MSVSTRRTRNRRHNPGRVIAMCGVGAAVLALVAALLGVIPPVLELWSDEPSDTQSCADPPAVEITSSERGGNVGASFTLTVQVNCPPRAGHRYVLIAEPPADQVDPNNPHPEYYLSWRMERPSPGTYSLRRDVSGVAIGSAATYYVISLGPAAYDQLIAQQHSTGFVLALPDHVVVSNPLQIVRSW